LGKIQELIREDRGQGMAEYAFILLAVAMVVMVGYFALGNGLLNRTNEIATTKHSINRKAAGDP